MTDEERTNEAAGETVEDLEAPAAAQRDVAGGNCASPTCLKSTKIEVFCDQPTCHDTAQVCVTNTSGLVVHAY
jgi:hypothetical protein